MGSVPEPEIPYVDVLLVGAGFASFTLLNRLRKLGLSVQIYEKGAEAGGIWYWNVCGKHEENEDRRTVLTM